MLRAIIVDDEQKGINTLKMLIEKHTEGVKVIAQCTRAIKGVELIENYMPDIVFLDINMPKMNGFELLEKLSWKEFILIFTTAHHEYGLKALKSNAIDYLLKPIDPKELFLAIEKAKHRLNEKNIHPEFNYDELLAFLGQAQKQRILVNSKTGVESVDLNEIERLESMNNYSMMYLSEGRKILVAKSLKEFELQLCKPDSNFMRVHQSYIINLNKVVRFLKSSESIIMNDDQKVPVAKSRKESFFKWLNL
jgi:two-component system, LytTR family, response regulator